MAPRAPVPWLFAIATIADADATGVRRRMRMRRSQDMAWRVRSAPVRPACLRY